MSHYLHSVHFCQQRYYPYVIYFYFDKLITEQGNTLILTLELIRDQIRS